MPSRWATKSAKQTSSRTAPLPERNHFCSEARRSMSSNPVSEEIGLFFFQAEDGIRYGHVTGVQTCALPICEGSALSPRRHPERGSRERSRSDSKDLLSYRFVITNPPQRVRELLFLPVVILSEDRENCSRTESKDLVFFRLP